MSHPVEETLAIRFLATHPIVVNAHPIAIVLSEKSSISQTVLLEFALNVASIDHVVVSRAIRFRPVAAMVVNTHQTSIFQSD